MDFSELCRRRFSARSYINRTVEQDKLNAILEAGRLAPTAANNQPQKIIVVQKDLDKFGEAANIYGAPLALIICADKNIAWKRPFDGKNTVDIDASIVTDHMMLAAADLGLDSVWICYFKPDILRRKFEIPDNLEPINILAIGYSDEQPAQKNRKPLSDTVVFR
ncbi:MAG: nitroreductase family protein [Oscillospiraceae bacterium]|nr:nitroreductase family protein [Oscillospiraceae bacterium]